LVPSALFSNYPLKPFGSYLFISQSNNRPFPATNPEKYRASKNDRKGYSDIKGVTPLALQFWNGWDNLNKSQADTTLRS